MALVELVGSRVRVVLPSAEMAGAALAFFTLNRERLGATSSALPPDYYTEAFWLARMTQAQTEFQADISVRLFIERLEAPGVFIGNISFTQIFRGPFQAAYLGYALGAGCEGQGLMHESLQLAIAYMFNERRLHRIMANYLPSNVRSGNVLKRLGFRIDGTSPDYLFINGAWREHVLTSLTHLAWQPRPEDQALFGWINART